MLRIFKPFHLGHTTISYGTGAGANILLIVNRNLQPQPSDKVVARVNAAYTLKIYSPCKNGLHLVASNKKYESRFVNKKKTAKFSALLHTLYIGAKK